MTHHCHAINCETKTPPRMFMCGKHWAKVPTYLKDLIWRHYAPGQEKTKRISQEYADAAQAAIRAVAEQEGLEVTGDEPDLTLYDGLAMG